MTMDKARELAVQAWCHPINQNKVMDTDLAETFAEILVVQVEVARRKGSDETTGSKNK